MNSPLLTIVIVNWNGLRFLKGCLGSIYDQAAQTEVEVVFVDNGSTDGSQGYVRENFPAATVVEMNENLGFAAANNRGIERARGEYIFTLNNDTELAPDAIENLLSAVRASSSTNDVGMWAPKILSIDRNAVIDSVGGLVIYRDGIAKGRGRLEKDRGQYDGLGEVFIPSACAALYSKEMLDETGLFDEDFFAYCEDTDLGLRARLMGWKARSVADAVVFHHYSGTGGGYSKEKAYLVERNRLWVAIKNFPLRILLVMPFYTLWRYLVQVFGVARGRGAGARFAEQHSSLGLLTTLLRAYAGAIKALPRMLAKRRAIQKSRRVSAGEAARWLKTYGIGAPELVLKD